MRKVTIARMPLSQHKEFRTGKKKQATFEGNLSHYNLTGNWPVAVNGINYADTDCSTTPERDWRCHWDCKVSQLF